MALKAKVRGKVVSQVGSWGDSQLTVFTVSLRMAFPLRMRTKQFFFPPYDSSPVGLGPIFMAVFNAGFYHESLF